MAEEDVVQRGRMSALLKSDLMDRAFSAQDAVIDRLIRGYRMGNLTEKELYGAVGEIVALNDLANTLDSEMKRGIAESEKEHIGG